MAEADEADQAPPQRGEPPLIERARRTGWALMVLAILLLAAERLGAPGGPILWRGMALAAAMLGGLAIVNVALVRGLYRQIGAAQQSAAGPTPGPSKDIADADGMAQRHPGDSEGRG